MSKETNSLYSFGPFCLDPHGPVLLRDGQPVSLGPKTLETLLLLIEHAGRLVKKEELIEKVWPDTVVEEGNLAKNIFFLRKVLGRTENGRDYIETVPKRGYRFIATVKEVTNGRVAEACADLAQESLLPAIEKPAPVPVKRAGLRLWIVGTIGLVLIGATSLAIFRHGQTAALSTQDSILITGVTNRTGDPVFDRILKTALEATLEQSPYVNVVSEQKVADTLKLMAKPADTPLTDEIGREICLRNGIKAIITGSIATLGRRYVVTLKALNARTGDTLAQELEEANSKEEVLSALGHAGTELRRKLGESLSSVQKFDMPLREATTSSLEALKAYGLGLEHWSTDDATASIPLFEHAIELDPEFAAAYVALGRAYQRTGNTRLQEAFRKAYALRNRTSERERLDITAAFYQFATMQVDQTISSCLLWKQTYPRDFVPHRILGFEYAEVGRWEDSVEEFGAANRIDAGQYLPYAGLLYGYMALGRLSDAHSVYEQAHSRKLGGPDLEHFRYWLAFLDRDNGTMENFASTLSERPEFQTVAADTEAYFGRMDKARELWRRAAAVVLNRGDKASAAWYHATAALREALFENSTVARQNADVALGLIVADRTNPEPKIALALALAGNSQHARTLAEKAGKERPLDTALNDLWLAEIRSVLRLREGEAVAAVDELAPAATFERGWENPPLLPAYLRGQAWLTARRGEEAAKEFKKILDHPGIVLNAPIGALAHLGLGRAYRLEADAAQGEQCASLRAKARAAYEEFLTLWKDADPDIPILREAKAEYRKLK